MKKLLMAISLITVTISASAQLWQVNPQLKFQIASLPNQQLSHLTGKNIVTLKPFHFVKTYEPDITNINLAAFLKLGFDVPRPKNPKDYNLFLKLYHFPSVFQVTKTTYPLLKKFGLLKINTLKNYLSHPENVYIKVIYIAKSNTQFSKNNPYPGLTINTAQPNIQQVFNQNIPFLTLDIQSTQKAPIFHSQDAKARWTAQAVVYFHHDLIRSYQKTMVPIKCTDSKYDCFIQKSQPDRLVILAVPKKPIIFNNWRGLPMPQDPQHIFLSGLLLVSRTVYKASLIDHSRTTRLPPINSPSFKAHFHPFKTTLLEVGSVVVLSPNHTQQSE